MAGSLLRYAFSTAIVAALSAQAASAAPVTTAAQGAEAAISSGLIEPVHWVWHHHHRVWVSDHRYYHHRHYHDHYHY